MESQIRGTVSRDCAWLEPSRGFRPGERVVYSGYLGKRGVCRLMRWGGRSRGKVQLAQGHGGATELCHLLRCSSAEERRRKKRRASRDDREWKEVGHRGLKWMGQGTLS